MPQRLEDDIVDDTLEPFHFISLFNVLHNQLLKIFFGLLDHTAILKFEEMASFTIESFKLKE